MGSPGCLYLVRHDRGIASLRFLSGQAAAQSAPVTLKKTQGPSTSFGFASLAWDDGVREIVGKDP